MATKEKVLNIHQRLNKIMGDVGYIKKDKKISFGKGGGYTSTSHDSVTKLIHPMLVKYGINIIPTTKQITQEGNRTRVDLEFRWVNIDNPEDYFITEASGYGIDQQDKGIGKCWSVAQRYTVLKTLHLETGDKDDVVDHVDEDIEDDDIGFENEPATPSLTLSDEEQKELKEFVLDKGVLITEAVEIFKEHGYSKSAEIPKDQLGKIKTAIVCHAKKEVLAHA